MTAVLIRSRTLAAGVAVGALSFILACQDGSRPAAPPSERRARDTEPAAPYQAEVDEGLGAAVAILIDTSGSMAQVAAGAAELCLAT